MTDGAVAPLLQEYVPPPEAVRLVLLPDVIVTLAETEAMGGGFTATVALAVSEQVPAETITE